MGGNDTSRVQRPLSDRPVDEHIGRPTASTVSRHPPRSLETIECLQRALAHQFRGLPS